MIYKINLKMQMIFKIMIKIQSLKIKSQIHKFKTKRYIIN
jgi:hypothetical protein